MFKQYFFETFEILAEDDGVPGSKFDREPEHYTVEQLKRWLKCRGMKLSGKRDELVTRVSDSIKKGSHRVSDVSNDQGKWFADKVIKENQEVIVDKSIKSKLSFVPTVPVSGWRTFQSQDIPVLFNYGHIYYYAFPVWPLPDAKCNHACPKNLLERPANLGQI